MQRAGRIGRDEFQQDFLAAPGVAFAVAACQLQHLAQHRTLGALRQVEIDESGAGDFGAREQRTRWQRRDDGLGDFARRLAGRSRQSQRDAAGIVAVRRIARALDTDPCPGRRPAAARCRPGTGRPARSVARARSFNSRLSSQQIGRRVYRRGLRYCVSMGSTSSAKRTRRACASSVDQRHPLIEQAMQRQALATLEQQLRVVRSARRAIAAGTGPSRRTRGRGRRQQHALRPGIPAPPPPLRADARSSARRPIWRPLRGLPLTHCRGGEALVATRQQALQQRMIRIFRLDQHFAALVLAPGAAGDLHDGLREALGGTKIGAEETLIGIEHHHQRRCPGNDVPW